MQTENASITPSAASADAAQEKSSIEAFRDILMEMPNHPFTVRETWEIVHKVQGNDLGLVRVNEEGCWYTAPQAVAYALRCNGPNAKRLRAAFRRLAN